MQDEYKKIKQHLKKDVHLKKLNVDILHIGLENLNSARYRPCSNENN